MANGPSSAEFEDGRLLAQGRPGDNAAPLSVSEISQQLKRTVEDRFGHVRVRGELSGVKRAASGHFYCALKDENAVIDGVMWRGNAGRLAFRPEDGIEVIATGKLTTYPGRSKYQIVIDSMEIAGEGALLAMLARIKAKLEAEGLFAPERKRRLPFLPRTIGVVTSPTGAVIRDILHRLNDRFPSHVLVWPVMVQGQGAAEQIAAAVEGFSRLPAGGAVPRPDLVIVARGGGSIEDLWAFNEEVVVRAVAASTIPTISAVGHETDTTLCDFAADLRAPTPTAAAEIAVPVRQELRALLDEYAARQRRGVIRPVGLARERLLAWSERLPDPAALVEAQGQRLDDLTDRLRRGLAGRAEQARRALAESGGGLRPALLQRNIDQHRRELARVPDARALVIRRHRDAGAALQSLARVLPQLNPYAPLERGYAVVTGPDGHAVTTRAAAAMHDRLNLRFRDGEIDVSTGTAPAAPPTPPKPRRRSSPKSSQEGNDSGQQSLF
ncbi:exodeoxyribonuclease VII large subunit [Croceicoccus naphthovorans]|uniref:Exodeoxyribonuclease 7 large subunit n=1 Tax=Croceicoccus naphthovorans TaxID=1348774 RepID=A0A0G3XL53_9SPHN|nr:exodeoxyribonuclease VII large subunit [Croceicoccus naphthovorans]AKM11133.1 exodeoxyribonuclease VII large subunit [Croceicoccus naphthovorans]MBB3989410.1 exodeoxyribonuclease VII large subunit [Croceicoccus naphthovorans]